MNASRLPFELAALKFGTAICMINRGTLDLAAVRLLADLLGQVVDAERRVASEDLDGDELSQLTSLVLEASEHLKELLLKTHDEGENMFDRIKNKSLKPAENKSEQIRARLAELKAERQQTEQRSTAAGDAHRTAQARLADEVDNLATGDGTLAEMTAARVAVTETGLAVDRLTDELRQHSGVILRAEKLLADAVAAEQVVAQARLLDEHSAARRKHAAVLVDLITTSDALAAVDAAIHSECPQAEFSLTQFIAGSFRRVSVDTVFRHRAIEWLRNLQALFPAELPSEAAVLLDALDREAAERVSRKQAEDAEHDRRTSAAREFAQRPPAQNNDYFAKTFGGIGYE